MKTKIEDKKEKFLINIMFLLGIQQITKIQKHKKQINNTIGI